MKMWLIPPKNPWVECVWEPWCARSVYYQPFSTALKHARTEALHARFHFFHGWAVTRENQTPPFPKCDPVHFTSGIKTFQWSQEGVLSPYKKATPMGRQTPPQKIKIKSVFGWCAGCTCDGNTSCFPYTSLWISFYSPNGLRCNHWHTPATPTLNVPTHTLTLRCHRTPHSHLITFRKLCARTSRLADWCPGRVQADTPRGLPDYDNPSFFIDL